VGLLQKLIHMAKERSPATDPLSFHFAFPSFCPQYSTVQYSKVYRRIYTWSTAAGCELLQPDIPRLRLI
jgi:hypothetical protein